jgi:2-oxoglutarate ferredoxin oxidoreductase subunit gamma
VIVSPEPIAYPYITSPEIMIVMSQEAYSKFTPDLATGGILITEEELVQPHNLRKDVRHYSIPATRIAEELGKKLVVNIVMMGFLTSITGLVGKNAMEQAILASVPKGTEELNLKAFERGHAYGAEVAAGGREPVMA